MPKKEFVMRGQTPSGNTEVLNFSGKASGYAYRLIEFQIYPAQGIGSSNQELCATITAATTAHPAPPTTPDFSDAGLIGTVLWSHDPVPSPSTMGHYGVINDLFNITQDLILAVEDTVGSLPINWQCKFESVKMSGPEEATTNFNQFTIND